MTATHTNVFADEASFLDHYARARHIARHPFNHVRVCDGADILGVPMLDDGGNVVELDGRPTWRQTPSAGFVPDADAWVDKAPDVGVATQLHHLNTRLYEPPKWALWVEVSEIAPHLQTTLLVGVEDGPPRVACRVTPEIRVERAPGAAGTVLVRTLSFEWRMFGEPVVSNAMVADLLDQQSPLLRMWYPLADGLARTAYTAKGVGPVGPITNLMIRLRALHEAGTLVT